MNKALEIDKAEKALIEANEKLVACKAHIHKIEIETFVLRNIENTLLENMEVLRSENIIAIASEYRKAKDELKHLRERLSFLAIDLSNHEIKLAQIDKIVLKCREVFVIAMLGQWATVIKVDFRRKNGQK